MYSFTKPFSNGFKGGLKMQKWMCLNMCEIQKKSIRVEKPTTAPEIQKTFVHRGFLSPQWPYLILLQIKTICEMVNFSAPIHHSGVRRCYMIVLTVYIIFCCGREHTARYKKSLFSSHKLAFSLSFIRLLAPRILKTFFSRNTKVRM